jgi:hypothetical protein
MQTIRAYIQKIVLASLLVFGFAFAIPVPALAVDVTGDVCSVADGRPAICGDAEKAQSSDPAFGPQGVVTRGIRIFLTIVGITTIFVMIINGVRMITANGSSDSFNRARDGIIYASIGLVIVIAAQSIVSFIVKRI